MAKKKFNTGLSVGAEEKILSGVTGIVKEATDAVKHHSDENTAAIIGGMSAATGEVVGKVEEGNKAVISKVEEGNKAVSAKVDNGVKTITDKMDTALGRKSIVFIVISLIVSVILGFIIFKITGNQTFLVPDYDATGNFLGTYHRDPWTYFVTVLIPAVLAVFLIYTSNWGYRRDNDEDEE